MPAARAAGMSHPHPRGSNFRKPALACEHKGREGGSKVETTPTEGVGRRRIIKRPRLTRMLDESGARIILLVAPAGYGKTTLAHEWLEEKQAAWYRCSPASADVAALAVGLADAASTVVVGAGAAMKERLRGTDRPGEEARVLGGLLASDLASWPSGAWIAIDDYHLAMDSRASEVFIEVLTELTSIQLVATSRRRPSWGTARKRVYGELLEIDRGLLAMTDDEARAVLAPTTDDLSGLLASARGWPAVLGLAAIITDLSFPADTLRTTLYDFFAEELYQAAGSELRAQLCQLAIAPTVTAELVDHLFPRQGYAVVLQAVERGFLSPAPDGTYDLHPTLRGFLRQELIERGTRNDTVAQISRFLLQREAWDDAFALAKTECSSELLVDVIRLASLTLLSSGRVATLESWLSYAADQHVSSPVIDFAESEVAFRNASYERAHALASQAANRLDINDGLTSRAFARAGHSAFLNGDTELAAGLHEDARRYATTARDLRDALWGRFLCAIERDMPNAHAALDEFAQAAKEDPNESLRVPAGQILLGIRGLRPLDPNLLKTIHLAGRADDHLVKSSFFNIWMGFAVLLGRYEDALALGEAQAALISRYRLNFVLPHLHLRNAAALRGLRRFRESVEHLEKAERASDGPKEDHLAISVLIAHALSELAQGRPAVALEHLNRRPAGPLSSSWEGEYLACRALTLAVLDEDQGALAHASRALLTSNSVDTQTLGAFAKAIVACRLDSDDAAADVANAYRQVRMNHNIDGLVTAYRSRYPRIAESPLVIRRGTSASDRRRSLFSRRRPGALCRPPGQANQAGLGRAFSPRIRGSPTTRSGSNQ